MRIAISGTHNSGKTSLIKALKESEIFSDFTFIDGPTRTIRKLGFEINENGTDETQLMCLATDIQNLLLNTGNVISDRCILDTYIYSLYLKFHNKISEDTLMITKLLWEKYKSCYDIIFMPSHFEVNLEDDGERSTAFEFRDTVYRLFLEEINNNIGTLSCYIIGGTVEQRVNTIVQILGRDKPTELQEETSTLQS